MTVSKAFYQYRILDGEESCNPLKDIECTFTFTIKRAFSTRIHILIAQDHGDAIYKNNYRFNNSNEMPAELTPISIKSSVSNNRFTGFYRAEIILPKRIWWCSKKKRPVLTVTFRLEKSHNTDREYEPFLICPFIYAKKMHSFEVEMDCSELSTSRYPAVVRLLCYPYDGTRYMPEPIANLPEPPDGVWKKDIPKCHTNAIYLLEVIRKQKK